MTQTQKTVEQLFQESVQEAVHTLATASGAICRNGLCCVHAVCTDYQETLSVAGQSGSPTLVRDSKMFPEIAQARAEWQVKTSPRPTCFVPHDYEGYYPQSMGSAVRGTVHVGIASDQPQYDQDIAKIHAIVIYDRFQQKLQAAGLLDKAA